MDDFEGSVAKIDDVAVLRADGRRGRAECDSASRPILPACRRTFRRSHSGRPAVHSLRGSARICRFGRVHAALREFVVAADMIEMRVAGDADKLALRHQRHVATKAEMAKPGIEQ